MGLHDGHREKMRQRLLNSGVESMADHEILEMLLFYAIPRKNTNEIAHTLLKHFGSLHGVLFARPEELRQIAGMGESAACLFLLTLDLCRRARLELAGSTLQTQEQALAYLREKFFGEKQEMILQLFLNRRGQIVLSRRMDGMLRWAGMDLQALVRDVSSSASIASLLLAHNHPGGDPTPSQMDYAATDQVRTALDAVGVQLWDHIILAGDRGEQYVSMRESGYLMG